MSADLPDPHQAAWAAGLYDGEGSCSAYLPKKRRSYRRQMAVSQGGLAGTHPVVLLRFKEIVGVGNITGPYRGYLYYWKTTRKDAIDRIGQTLWPYLGLAKREQFESAAVLAKRDRSATEFSEVSRRSIDVAWAAGFFDGEGSVWVNDDPMTGSSRAIEMEIPQSGATGVPEALSRFLRIVAVGRISGPHQPTDPWARLPKYRWKSGGMANVETLAALLWPWLGPVKRAQFENAMRLRRASMKRPPDRQA